MMQQLSFLMPETTWTPPTEWPSLSLFPRISLDTETHDPFIKSWGPGWPIKRGKVVGVSIGTDSWSRYWPIDHPEGNVDKDKTLAWLKSELANYSGELVGASLMYDLGWLGTHDIIAPRSKLVDVQFAEALLDENRGSYSLDAICEYHGIPGKDEGVLKAAAMAMGLDPKGGLWQLPAKYVGAYAEGDADRPLRIWDRQQLLIKEQGLQRVFDLEHSLIPILMKMRSRGVRVDLDKAERVRNIFRQKEQAVLGEIKDIVGFTPAVMSPDDVARAFKIEGLDFPRTSLGSPSFKAEWLEAQPHALPKAIVRARKFNKAWSMFIDNVVTGFEHQGRVYPEFHPLRTERDEDGKKSGAVSGRFASSSPNLQFIPARDPEIGPMIRSLYLPEDGERWGKADWSAQEPRLTLHYALLLGLSGSQKTLDQLLKDPRESFHGLTAKITGLPKSQAKTINLALTYTAGGAKICDQMGLPVEWWETPDGKTVRVAGQEGKRIIAQYHSEMPYIKKIMEFTKERAEERGFIQTLSGRRSRFELYEPRGYQRGWALPYDQAVKKYGSNNIQRAFTKDALNRLVQGGAADMMKYSMIELAKEGIYPLAVVHDENDVSVGSDAQMKRINDIMVNCVQLQVPMSVEFSVGPNWGETEVVQL